MSAILTTKERSKHTGEGLPALEGRSGDGGGESEDGKETHCVCRRGDESGDEVRGGGSTKGAGGGDAEAGGR